MDMEVTQFESMVTNIDSRVDMKRITRLSVIAKANGRLEEMPLYDSWWSSVMKMTV